MHITSPLFFVKLGGSLITDKRTSETARQEIINRLAREIATARQQNPALRLLIGHGSGSFGHTHGRRYQTRQGVQTPDQWFGFAVVSDAAARLNRIVTAALLAAGIPVWSIQPSATLRCTDGKISAGPLATIEAALARGLVPLVFGDVALDDVRGGTIASTEEIFEWLAGPLQPQRLILAGEVDGVYTADPTLEPAATRIDLITPTSFAAIQSGLGGSHGVDVTGGMLAKVAESIAMVTAHPGLDVIVCSGLQAGHLQEVLLNPHSAVGTRISRA